MRAIGSENNLYFIFDHWSQNHTCSAHEQFKLDLNFRIHWSVLWPVLCHLYTVDIPTGVVLIKFFNLCGWYRDLVGFFPMSHNWSHLVREKLQHWEIPHGACHPRATPLKKFLNQLSVTTCVLVVAKITANLSP